MKRLRDWYEHPEYYEAIFGPDSAKEMDFLLALNSRYGTGGNHFLEPACGAGRLLQEGARRNLRMVGYDLSDAMLRHARARLGRSGRVKLFRAGMQDFEPPDLLGQFDMSFNLVSTFRYLQTDADAQAHLERTRRLLKPGGLYVLGFHLTDYRRDTLERERWVGRSGRDRVVCNTREWPPDRKLRSSRMRNRLRITGSGKDWLIETQWHFRTYDERQAGALFRRAGFSVQRTFDFDYRIDEPLIGPTLRLDRVFVLSAT